MELMGDAVCTETNGSDYRDEDEQAPTGAQSIFTDEDLPQSGRPCRNYLVDRSGFFTMKQGLGFGRIVQVSPFV